MIRYFENINEFIQFRKKCVFCDHKLKPILSNFTTMSGGLPCIRSKYDGNNFYFHLNYNSASANIDCGVLLDCNSNNFNFSKIDLYKYHQVYDAINSLGLHIELCCSQPSCKLKYYISSDVLNVVKIKDNIVKLQSIKLYTESFKIGKRVIQNDFQNDKMNIYSINRPDASPIQVAIMDLETIDKDKLLNKISIYVNFS